MPDGVIPNKKTPNDSHIVAGVHREGSLGFQGKVYRQKERPRTNVRGLLIIPAVTYSPTRATLQYHRRNAVSLLCSEWEQVGPARYRRRKDVIVLLTTEYGE